MDSKYKLFFEEDEIIVGAIEGHSRWIVNLSNGKKVYQDDFREYPEFDDERRYSTWVRLRDYCKQEKIDIVGMTIQFRTNRDFLPENADGYYFVKSVLGMFGGDNVHFFIGGFVRDNKIFVKRWQVPELIITGEEERELKKDDLCLILRN